jgi:hypothetical protein
MLTRRYVRNVAPYSPTLFFEDKGAVYGTAANGAQLLENWLNKTFPLRAQPMTVSLNPVSRDKLFDTLLGGDADIAAGDTERRKKWPSRRPLSTMCARSS